MRSWHHIGEKGDLDAAAPVPHLLWQRLRSAAARLTWAVGLLSLKSTMLPDVQGAGSVAALFKKKNPDGPHTASALLMRSCHGVQS